MSAPSIAIAASSAALLARLNGRATESGIERVSIAATRTAAWYISVVSVASCRSPAAGVLSRGSSRSVSGCMYDRPFTVSRTV